MKFFYKMFLGMTVILAVALGMIEYVTLSYSLEHAVKREQDSALSQHQMIKYSIETVILNMKSEDVDKELTDMMSQSAKSIVGDEGGMYLAADDGKRIYANSCNYEQKDIKVKDGTLTYSIVSKENTKDTGEKQSGRYIHVKSSFKLNDNRYILITESDITPVFDESKELRYRCSVYYIVILAVGMMVVFTGELKIAKLPTGEDGIKVMLDEIEVPVDIYYYEVVDGKEVDRMIFEDVTVYASQKTITKKVAEQYAGDSYTVVGDGPFTINWSNNTVRVEAKKN